ncbi:MAG: GntR family transcriptional regulator [Oscillospiraceae bacterium]|nr:GntR family transcriptional regulator [Oscillospiraceae bacterium]
MLHMKVWQTGFDPRQSIYEQIVQRFHRSLVSGELSGADRIPSIRDLAVSLGVNTNTIQRAYQEMERSGLIYSKRGMGFFIVEEEQVIEKVKQEVVSQAVVRFLSEMRSLGFDDAKIFEELKNHMKGGGDQDGSANG